MHINYGETELLSLGLLLYKLSFNHNVSQWGSHATGTILYTLQ